MAKPNDFEQAILDAAVSAQRFHIRMTGGAYIWYSHESFLQNFMAIQIFKKTKHYIYVDASPKKIREDTDSGFVGKQQPKKLNQRFDLVCWLKSEDKVKAIIEIKETLLVRPVMDDIHKVSEYLKTDDGSNVKGYVLYYTDHRRNERRKGKDSRFIQNRFQRVNKEMGKSSTKHGLVADYICDPKGKDEDPWGYALFRVLASGC